MKNKVYYGEYSLKHWVYLILSGNIELPEYQRSFAWEKEDVKRLIDTFKDDQFVPPVTIGVYTKNNKKQNLILDGQQRLSSILLAYLGLCPIKEKFNKTHSPIDNEDNEDNTNQSNDKVIQWRFPILLGNCPKTKLEIINELNQNSEEKQKYYFIDFGIDDDFLNNKYLGFSLLIPNESEQKNYFASTFIDINSSGKELNPLEIREALYYLDENLEEFFSPKYTSNYIVKPKGSSAYKLDFVKYLSMISQYLHNDKSAKNIAVGTRSKQDALERDYFRLYIQSAIKDEISEIWGNYSKISESFPNGSWKEGTNNVGKYLELLLGKESNFSSLIKVDIYLFGLVYFVLFENKKILEHKIPELKDKLEKISNDFQLDKSGHAKSPSLLQYIKKRIEKSIEIYKEFIDESA